MLDINLLQLEEPSYILTVNWPCRYLVNILLLTCVLGGTPLLIFAYINDRFDNGYWFFVVLIAFFTYVLLLPRLWRPWIQFVADKNGFYLGRTNTSSPYFVPWDRIGRTSIGITSGDNVRKGNTVFFQWKVNDDDRRFFRKRFLKEIQDEAATYGIGGACRSPGSVRMEIEKIRTLCGYEPA